MWIQTAHRVADNGDIFDVYRDRDANQCVTHFAAHRGGCLYIGEVSLVDQNDGRGYSFSTTSAPWSDTSGPEAAASYWERHADKLS